MSESAPAVDGRVDVSVVVPLLNEAATLDELVTRVGRALADHHAGFELVLVDDGSNDATAELLARLEAEQAWIRAFALTRNFGQPAAVACGLAQARGRIVVTMDGDLQNPPEEIGKLVDAIQAGAAIATGRRATRHEAAWRWLASRVVHWCARALTGARIEDFGGQFKAYRRDALDAALARWRPGSAFFPLAVSLGFPVTEVAVRHDPRRHGSSRYNLRALVRMMVELAASAPGLHGSAHSAGRFDSGYEIKRRPHGEIRPDLAGTSASRGFRGGLGR